MSITFEELEAITEGKMGRFDSPCPQCSHLRKPHNRNKRTFRVWRLEPAFATFNCVRCGCRGSARLQQGGPKQRSPALTRRKMALQEDADAAARIEKARTFWKITQGIEGTIGERYVREVRAYTGEIPRTIRFLPEWCGRPAAMVAAFGYKDDDDDLNFVDNPSAIFGVHITKLNESGTGKAGTPNDKIMFGKPSGHPIVLSPPNDGLGLIITEGIEDGLSALSVAGTAVWVAGSASHLSRLADAVPSYFEVVTILADTDSTGQRNAKSLQDLLRARSILATAVSIEAQDAVA